MADFQSIVYQMILSVLRDVQITSAGGDSPKINTFKGLSSAGSPEIGLDEELKEAIREAVGEISEDPDSADQLSENLLDAEEKSGISKVGINPLSTAKKTIGAAQNPANIVAMGLQLLPHAALISFAISLAPLIFDVLTRPGGPLDLRFKRIVDDEINAFLSRQTQKDTEMGVRQVIIQSKKGFTAVNGVNNYNTIRGIREGGIDKERLDRQGKVEHTKGEWPFG